MNHPQYNRKELIKKILEKAPEAPLLLLAELNDKQLYKYYENNKH